MLLWLAFLLLTVLAVAGVAWPLLGLVRRAPIDDGQDAVRRRAVYADQLAAVDGEIARGTVSPEEGAAARVELSRRLLAETGDEAPRTASSGERQTPFVLRAAVVGLLPVLAFGIYAVLGSPSLPGRPFVVTKNPTEAGDRIEVLVDRVEARLREAPQDGRGWDVVAPIYLQLRRFEQARTAYARAIELEGETIKRLAGLAESAVRAANGAVTDEARAAYEKILHSEPGRIDARFFLAMAREQRGELAQAADEYRTILATAPADAPWRSLIRERLAAIGAGQASPDSAPGGPTREEMRAAQDLPAEARAQMIGAMVERLHTRLKANGGDAAGWRQLVRAYGVQGERDKAKAALTEARQALRGDESGLAALEALAHEMGLGS